MLDFVTIRKMRFNADVGLLVLRLCGGVSLFVKHGFEKPAHFAEMAQHFPDPIHIGAVPSLVIALVADAICSLLVAIGLATRWAALFACGNIFVAWALVHHFEYLGKQADHGEVCVLYMIIFLAIFLAGPGRFSVDERLSHT